MSDLTYETVPDLIERDTYRVEAINHASEGECYVAIFSGPLAKGRAEEYAAWKNRRTANASLSKPWPAFADLPSAEAGLATSPRLSWLVPAVVLSPEDYERARNALLAEDVKMRRGWFAVRDSSGRWVAAENVAERISAVEGRGARHWPHPFTALIEADEWYKANVEAAEDVERKSP
jgi:hypothetical protein